MNDLTMSGVLESVQLGDHQRVTDPHIGQPLIQRRRRAKVLDSAVRRSPYSRRSAGEYRGWRRGIH